MVCEFSQLLKIDWFFLSTFIFEMIAFWFFISVWQFSPFFFFKDFFLRGRCGWFLVFCWICCIFYFWLQGMWNLNSNQGSDLNLLHWEAKSYTLNHQEVLSLFSCFQTFYFGVGAYWLTILQQLWVNREGTQPHITHVSIPPTSPIVLFWTRGSKQRQA